MTFRVSLGVILVAAASVQVARADTATDATESQPTSESSSDASVGVPDPAADVHYGVGVRFRSVHAPKSFIEVGVDRAAGGASNLGFGLEVTRRRNNSELQLSMEFEHITPKEGVWIAKGDNVAAGDEADWLLEPKHAPNGDKLGWVTFEFTYLKHTPITKQIALRYGGGAGLGVITGKLWRYDVPCNGATNDNPEPGCKPAQLFPTESGTSGNSRGPAEYNTPPVFPVINAIIGLQFRPVDQWTINVEGGFRTFLFFGVSTSYFF